MRINNIIQFAKPRDRPSVRLSGRDRTPACVRPLWRRWRAQGTRQPGGDCKAVASGGDGATHTHFSGVRATGNISSIPESPTRRRLRPPPRPALPPHRGMHGYCAAPVRTYQPSVIVPVRARVFGVYVRVEGCTPDSRRRQRRRRRRLPNLSRRTAREDTGRPPEFAERRSVPQSPAPRYAVVRRRAVIVGAPPPRVKKSHVSFTPHTRARILIIQ